MNLFAGIAVTLLLGLLAYFRGVMFTINLAILVTAGFAVGIVLSVIIFTHPRVLLHSTDTSRRLEHSLF